MSNSILWNMSNSTNSTIKNETTLDVQGINIVLNFKYAATSLSIFGLLIIIYSYLYLCVKVRFKISKKNAELPEANQMEMENYKSIKMGYGNDLIFCLSISELICAVFSFIKSDSIFTNINDSICIVQGLFSNLFEISSICWTTAISVSILLATKSTEISKIPRYYCYFFIYSYVLPVILSIGPLLTNSYGPAGAWCWMDLRDNNNNSAMTWAISIYIFHWFNIIFNYK